MKAEIVALRLQMRLERSRLAPEVRRGVDVRWHEDLHVGEVRQRRLLVASRL